MQQPLLQQLGPDGVPIAHSIPMAQVVTKPPTAVPELPIGVPQPWDVQPENIYDVTAVSHEPHYPAPAHDIQNEAAWKKQRKDTLKQWGAQREQRVSGQRCNFQKSQYSPRHLLFSSIECRIA